MRKRLCVRVVMRNNNKQTIVRTSAAARIISRSASSAKLDGSSTLLASSLCRRNRLHFTALVRYIY
jgi:hypothetical protein